MSSSLKGEHIEQMWVQREARAVSPLSSILTGHQGAETLSREETFLLACFCMLVLWTGVCVYMNPVFSANNKELPNNIFYLRKGSYWKVFQDSSVSWTEACLALTPSHDWIWAFTNAMSMNAIFSSVLLLSDPAAVFSVETSDFHNPLHLDWSDSSFRDLFRPRVRADSEWVRTHNAHPRPEVCDPSLTAISY